MYIKKTYVTGKVIEVEKIYSRRYHPKNCSRSNRINPTSLEMLKVNERNAKKKLRRLINTNFEVGDYSLTLTYGEVNQTKDPEDAKKDLQKFIRKLRDKMHKEGQELKYVSVTEYGKNTIHHHLVIKKTADPNIIQQCWTKGYVKFSPLRGEGDFSALSDYMLKQTCKSYELSDEGVFKKRWNQSSNLVIPEPQIEVVGSDSWRSDPVVPQGYQLIQDSLRVGVSDYTGYAYQHYRIVAIPRFRKKDRRRKRGPQKRCVKKQ